MLTFPAPPDAGPKKTHPTFGNSRPMLDLQEKNGGAALPPMYPHPDPNVNQYLSGTDRLKRKVGNGGWRVSSGSSRRGTPTGSGWCNVGGRCPGVWRVLLAGPGSRAVIQSAAKDLGRAAKQRRFSATLSSDRGPGLPGFLAGPPPANGSTCPRPQVILESSRRAASGANCPADRRRLHPVNASRYSV